MRIRGTYVDPYAPVTLIQLKDLVLWRRNNIRSPHACMTASGHYPTRYLQWGVSQCSCDGFCVRQALSFIFWWLLDSRRKGRMHIVVIEQLLDRVKLPIRDGVVKLQDSAELRRRVGDGHSHDGGCSLWVLSTLPILTLLKRTRKRAS